jgi:predicted transcriptional regulator
MLQMNQDDLAKRSGVPRSAIAAFEAEERSPRSGTIKKLRTALEGAGAVFVDSERGSGVMLHR